MVNSIELCPHKLFKLPCKKTDDIPSPGFELHHRQGDTQDVQRCGCILCSQTCPQRREIQWFRGGNMEKWLIENHGFQPQYAVSKLNEKNFRRMFDAGLYEEARNKYGTLTSVCYKCKKGRKTEKEVQEAEQAHMETAYAEVGYSDIEHWDFFTVIYPLVFSFF